MLGHRISTAGRLAKRSNLRGLLHSGRSLSQSVITDEVDRAAQGLVRTLQSFPFDFVAKPRLRKGSFLAGAHRELSVALIKCQGSAYRGAANLLARAAGRQVSPGAEVAFED